MTLDAQSLRDFYVTPLGQVVRRQLAARVRRRWTGLKGETVLGIGYATPYLGPFRTEVARLGCLMPARQGAVVWPARGQRCHTVLVEERQWPVPDASVDRILAVHSLEQASQVKPVLREMWRVLKPEGRLLLIVPNRRGVWSRMDGTPFGDGQPFSRSQLEQQLTEALFSPVEWDAALYFPPLGRRWMLRISGAVERVCSYIVPPFMAGVIIVEARKELVAPMGRAVPANDGMVLVGGERPVAQSRSTAGGI